jgi:hypothetical protein
MEGDGEKKLTRRKEPDKLEIPDRALTMQAMSLAEPRLCRVQGSLVTNKEELDFSWYLLMKVACTGGSPRLLSQQALQQTMERDWKEKFHGIFQVTSNVFMAHFKTKEDMISVYIKQPWVVNSENLLLDWFDPNFNAMSSAGYRFDSFLITVRDYGIQRNKRSISLLKNILNQVGEVSDFHILQQNNLFTKQDYIWGTAKMMVANPVKVRAVVSFEDDSSTISYLHYEKINRACLFCEILFHIAKDCNRNSLISERQRNMHSSADIPTERYGQWIIIENQIPTDLIHNARMEEQTSNQGGTAIMNILREMFSQDPKSKGRTNVIGPANMLNGNEGLLTLQANVQGKIQLGTSCNDAAQTVCEDSGRASMEMDFEAAAPALKAPRAP